MSRGKFDAVIYFAIAAQFPLKREENVKEITKLQVIFIHPTQRGCAG